MQPFHKRRQKNTFLLTHSNTGLMSSRISLTSCGGAFLALVGHPSSVCVKIKISYGKDVLLHNQPRTPSFPIGLVIVSSVETWLSQTLPVTLKI